MWSRRHPIVIGSALAATCLAFLLACSVPNLEDPDCTQARDIVREFYSFHFGNDMIYSAENLEKRKVFLTPRLTESIRNSSPVNDPFTRTGDAPKAFKVAACRVRQPESRVEFDVNLFWKTDTLTEQRPIKVGAEKVNGKWLIDTIE